MADLWERLRAAQQRGVGPTAPEASLDAPAPPAPPPGEEPCPPGWEWLTPLVARRTLAFDLDPGFWRAVGALVAVEGWRGVLCFDTETTGLSGGAGTVAFLVGWAALVPGAPDALPRVEVTQYFLRDHPGEGDLIAALDAAFAGAQGLVSFNGASFDLPLLRSRWALAGRDFPEVPHRDDLHPSRRLWKRLLDSCRLGRLEQTVLGVHRVDDVPGALVPQLWFDYLRAGAAPDFATPLEGVLRHHAQDVYSLLCLDLVLGALGNAPEAPRWRVVRSLESRSNPARLGPSGLLHPDLGPYTGVDFWGLLALRDTEGADRSLEAAWDGDEAVGLAWADRLKRRSDPRATEVWAQLWLERRSYPALEEWLKWLEHREATPEARARALELVNEGLKAGFLPTKWRDALEKRRERLQRKVRPSEGP